MLLIGSVGCGAKMSVTVLVQMYPHVDYRTKGGMLSNQPNGRVVEPSDWTFGC